MKISVNDIRTLPSSMGFGFCVYGEPSEIITKWANRWGFRIVSGEGGYTNIIVPKNYDISECFEPFVEYSYVDGFSPNLNKHLHIGHMSNFIIAKTFQSMGVGREFISILGDTLDGGVEKGEAYNMYRKYCEEFGLDISQIFYASHMTYTGDKLEDGEGDYSGTKVFNTGSEKIVGIKSDGSTSYFYQDMALAEMLGDSTLYLTGHEQDNHFKALKEFYPQTNHVGLGLVKVGTKMSSRDGNVIFFSDLIEECLEEFDNDLELVYNVLAGFILKIEPTKDKNINLKLLKNPKNSPGLYLSYTLARLKSAGVKGLETDEFNSTELQFKYLKSLHNLQPNILFNALIEHCKLINNLYSKFKIEGHPENEVMFSNLKEDLELGMSKLGLFLIDKV
jgi:arginyl-tRNA synthetase